MTEPKSLRIRDYRNVKLDLPPGGIYLSWTPAGRAPIACMSVEITYDITTSKFESAEVFGFLVNVPDENRRSMRAQGRGLRRNYFPDRSTGEYNVPDWLDVLIKRYQPAGGAR